MSDLELMFTTCFICQEKYYDADAENGSRNITCQRHPIQSFQCGHVLCAVCIANMHVAKVERDSESDNDWITCPFCNTPNSFHPIEQISSLLVKQYQEMKRTDGNRQGQQQRMSKSSDTSSDTDISSDSDASGWVVSTIPSTVESNEPFRKLTVTGAGINAINGDFVQSGTVDFAPKYDKTGSLNGEEVTFSLYRCQLLDRSRKWFISIVPLGSMPGTNKDIDLYWAPYTSEDGSTEVPATGWEVVKDKGKLPVPTVVPCMSLSSDTPGRFVSTILLTVESNEPCRKLTVTGAGIDAINGDFVHSGSKDFAPKFNKTGFFDGGEVMFSLYRCQLLDRSRKWYISIVPPNTEPGTARDIDFYYATCTSEDSTEVPETGWMVVRNKGTLPVPTVVPFSVGRQ